MFDLDGCGLGLGAVGTVFRDGGVEFVLGRGDGHGGLLVVEKGGGGFGGGLRHVLLERLEHVVGELLVCAAFESVLEARAEPAAYLLAGSEGLVEGFRPGFAGVLHLLVHGVSEAVHHGEYGDVAGADLCASRHRNSSLLGVTC